MADIFAKSRHGLNAFAMVIVGRHRSAEGIYVGLWNGAMMHRLADASEQYRACESGTGHVVDPDVERVHEPPTPPILVVDPKR